MPWTVDDVDRFKQGLTIAQKRRWVRIANDVLARCEAEGGRDCERRAIMSANATVEAREAGRVLSKENENKLRAAADALAAVLALLDKGAETESGEEEADAEANVAESAIQTEIVPLVERAVRRDGTIPVKLIAPGWGSSGYYPAEVLERDGPQVFRAGTQMLWDHPTPSEEIERPEGSLNALAAELVSDARYDPDGPAGPGLYADAKVFGPYREAIDELASHIGVSIRAMGRAVQGEAEGRKGPIIQALTQARTVDFVTQAGAGGRIVEMFEAARRSQPHVQEEDQVNEKQLQEALAARDQEIARLREAMLLRDARDFVRDAVARANVPDVTKTRLVENLTANPPVRDGVLDTDAYADRIAEAIRAEVEYLTKAAGHGAGRIEGMGGQPVTQPSREDISKRMADAFRRLGLSESGVQVAVNGRGY